MTDRGALVIHRNERWYRGSFLPLKYPGVHFFSAADSGSLEFNSFDGKARWSGDFSLVRDGYGIEGQIQLEESPLALPCQGRWIGSSADDGRPALLKVLEHEDPWMRREAAHALGALGPAGRDAIPGLIQALRDSDEDVLRAIHLALARLGAASEASVPMLRCHLKDDVPRVRAAAADALGGLGAQAVDAQTDLARGLEDPDVAVRVAALEALVSVSEGFDLAALLDDESPNLAIRVLEALRRRGPSAKETLETLADQLRHPASREAAQAALARLGKSAGAEKRGLAWPRWRGPNGDNVSKETGLLSVWPPGGPPLAWEVWGIGDGIAAPAVRDGRVFVLGHLHGWEYLTALDAETGRRLWSARLGPGVLEASHMRWVAQRTPTVGPELVHAFLNSGELVSLRVRDGKEEWRLNYSSVFGTRHPLYGVSDRPLLDGDRLICSPCSSEATIAALDASSGRVLWKSLAPARPLMPHPSTLAMEVAGLRQYIVSASFLHGFRASDGKHLWSTPRKIGDDYKVTTPMVSPENLLLAPDSGGIRLLRISPEGAPPEQVSQWPQEDGWLQDSSLVLSTRCYTPARGSLQGKSLGDLKAAPLVLELGGECGETALTAAEGRLYVFERSGKVFLVEPTDKALELRSSFQIPYFTRTSGTANPVIAGGRLHLRDDDRLLCFDVLESRAGATRQRVVLEAPASPALKDGPPSAVFVPTPRDIVNRMLEFADTQASDVVVDLGSGDGRILIAAAADFGARAVGWEIDSRLVRASRREVEERGLAESVRVEEGDLFQAGLADATVVALYLTEEDLTRLKPRLANLKPGARVVSHQSKIPGIRPHRTLLLTSREDSDVHAIHLWKAPLKPD